MFLSDFDYPLPPELIAQHPAQRRDASRVMTLNRESGAIGETVVADCAALFRPDDLLVLNDTRVIPARLFGKKSSGGKVEIFLVRREGGDSEIWSALIKASKSPSDGCVVELAEGVTATVLSRGEGEWRVRFAGFDDFHEWLERVGRLPLPPYIKREPEGADRERYQTVFARERGAVAAPTAGLHFTEELLGQIRARGTEIASLTLHVGLGTFMPVRVEALAEHTMHRESYRIPEETVAALQRTRQRGGRVIALGTTTLRALEHAASLGEIKSGPGEADIFILPGHRFRAVDALFTNFHLPKSTLFMLVCAFAGKERMLAAYAEAVQRRFRFFSYGDAMFIG
ncbi:tRNA preQ1(34) S-adenosylmethionine ribosyltransferase-isomerase QueA [Geomesophilobacter sediminis]|uniref:S-adenosylmethionine:tRNA ribosyltransferase-isomerase n=1 Tax=Geomesophilobacter sediminis TaxID=2798584 RepID=A0A8J7INE9_9BACT|nr:tRNA preQ1(34) S-adenosylmethionine ribosyltransferase-isomerase QueA [Geomesophilobacter sediminis]MBJ6723559.1 tRNA preQ1(34) S-adenosylmethionine ribosyltransferase-isomerase QueA [Geomesophilobacter sediminis]